VLLRDQPRRVPVWQPTYGQVASRGAPVPEAHKVSRLTHAEADDLHSVSQRASEPAHLHLRHRYEIGMMSSMKGRVCVLSDVTDVQRLEQSLRNVLAKFAAAGGAEAGRGSRPRRRVPERPHARVQPFRAGDPAHAQPTDRRGIGVPTPRRTRSSCTAVGCRLGGEVATVPAQSASSKMLSMAPRLTDAPSLTDSRALSGVPRPSSGARRQDQVPSQDAALGETSSPTGIAMEDSKEQEEAFRGC
jgi:hypothetical protein